MVVLLPRLQNDITRLTKCAFGGRSDSFAIVYYLYHVYNLFIIERKYVNTKMISVDIIHSWYITSYDVPNIVNLCKSSGHALYLCQLS